VLVYGYIMRQLMTIEEFYDFELTSPDKYEFVGGELRLMTGGSVAHGRMIHRLSVALDGPARAHGSEVFSADVKLRVGDLANFYPDVMVTCDPRDDHEQWRTKPCLLVEVLSRGVRAIERDRQLKSGMYRSLPSLLTYLIVDPDKPEITVHMRDSPRRKRWTQVVIGPGVRLPLACPTGFVLDVDALYA
jgi:Uma2 family endonuclease